MLTMQFLKYLTLITSNLGIFLFSVQVFGDEVIEISDKVSESDEQLETRILGFAIEAITLRTEDDSRIHNIRFDHIPARPPNIGGLYPTKSYDQYSLSWCALKGGDRFRAPGGIYELIERDNDKVALKRLEDEKVFDKNIYIIAGDVNSMRNGEYKTATSLLGTRLDTFLLIRKENEPPDAINLISYRFFKEPAEPAYRSELLRYQLVGVKDLVWIADSAYRITAIHPPDPKKRLRGWAEICDQPESKIVDGVVVDCAPKQKK
jgi:hypothetical protein